MNPEERIAVACVGCGQEYHVPPPKQEQRAQCRACGKVFVIPPTVVGRPVKPRPPKHLTETERAFSAAIANNLAKVSRLKTPHERSLTQSWRWRYAAAAGLAVAIAGVLLLSLAPPRKVAEQPTEYLQRGLIAKLSPPRDANEFRSISDLIETIEPSVVQVESWGNRARGVGSGFVLDPAGLIVTCYHCVEGTLQAKVVFNDRREMPVVGIRATSPSSDLVILQVQTREPLPALSLAGAPPRKGEPIVCFGSPAGLSFTTSEGSISALRSSQDVESIANKLRGGSRLYLSRDCDLVQFTATAMPGHSGGPMVDFFGNVLGVTSFGLPYEGRSFEFAISYSEIRTLSRNLSKTATPLADLVVKETDKPKAPHEEWDPLLP